MRISVTLKFLLILTILSISGGCSTTSQHWTRVEGIPKFDPQYHSDGCSGGMSATYSKLKFLHAKYGETLPWRDCCVIHDKAYYYGGSKEEKKMADAVLKECVSKTIGCSNSGLVLGNIMEDAVWIGGAPYYPTSYRWGFEEDLRSTQ